MDIEDDRPKPSAPLAALAAEDLELLSREELEDRIARLEAERLRTEQMLEKKGKSHSFAESLFKSPE